MIRRGDVRGDRPGAAQWLAARTTLLAGAAILVAVVLILRAQPREERAAELRPEDGRATDPAALRQAA